MWAGARWQVTMQDTTGQLWEGLNVVQDDTTLPFQGTFFDLVDTAQVVEITGVITEYYTTTQLNVLRNPVTPVEIIGQLNKRPNPLELSISDFMDNGQLVKDAEKYEGMYVVIRNVISSNRNPSSGSFNFSDPSGTNMMYMYNQSGFFRTDANRLTGITDYEPPQDGTPINFIRGILSTRTTGYYISPLYPGDINITATPPVISNIKRDIVQVNTNQPVTISANIIDLDGTVNSAALNYKIGNSARVSVAMNISVTDTTLYTATIPAVSTDSTTVNYYISAIDNDGLKGYNPSDTVKSNYFYQVLNATLKIRDVQYSPFGSGYSGYNGLYVTLTGVVTADTSDIPGFGTTPLRVYMQDGNGPWTGILIGTMGMKGIDVLKFKRGDSVTLTGKIVENYSVTSIDSLTNIVVNSDSNALPVAVDLKTSDIAKKASGDVSAEQWESVLVDYKNVTVTDDNADGVSGPGTTNHGEIFVTDGSGDTRVELQDGNHPYENLWDAALANDTSNIFVGLGAKFSEIRGILYYSYSYYKLVPRKADDFVGFVTDVKENKNITPKSFKLSQNYPNPFNPSTVITYSIPNESSVSLKIYNMIGQEVKTLVEENKAPGTYNVNFNASNLSSGVYFYSLRAGNYYQVKKMMLIK
jgi:predicted extracellular nuclease